MDLGLVQLEHTDPVGSARHSPSVECSHQRHPGDPRLPPLRPLPCWPLPCGSPAHPLRSAPSRPLFLPRGSAWAGNGRGSWRPGCCSAACWPQPGPRDRRQVVSTSLAVSRV